MIEMRRMSLRNCREADDCLGLLPATERELVSKVRDRACRECDEAFLELARLRLRNIVEKYTEALRRARLGKRSAPVNARDAELVDVLQIKLGLCRAALDECNLRLAVKGSPD